MLTARNVLAAGEASPCEEKLGKSWSDVSSGAVLGIGFPPFLSGPFHYADSLGLQVVVDKLSGLAEQHGARFIPADLLLERAREGRTFFES